MFFHIPKSPCSTPTTMPTFTRPELEESMVVTSADREGVAGGAGQFDPDRLGFGVFEDRLGPVFSAPSAALETAERYARSDHAVGVDPHGAGRDRGCDAVCALQVTGPHSGGQAVLGAVGQFECFVLGREACHSEYRAEDLFLRD